MRPECWLTLIMLWCFLRENALANSTRRHLVCETNGKGGSRIENMPLDLCTHVLYMAAAVDPESNEMQVVKVQRDVLQKGFQKLADLKKRRSDVKLLIGIHCFDDACEKMIATINTRKTFIESAIRFLRRYNFDGLSFTWLNNIYEKHDLPLNYLYHFPTFIEETKQAFKNAGLEWTVSFTGFSEVDETERWFYQERICRAADFVIISGKTNSKHTDVPNPLKRRKFDTEGNGNYIIEDRTKHWINGGCSRNKILIDMGFYAIVYTLENENNRGMHADKSYKTTFLHYGTVCSKLQEKGWTIDWDERSASPFAYRGNEWIGYENEASLEEKAHFADSEGLGGFAVRSLTEDDYKGVCGRKYPLLTALFEAYRPTWSTDDVPFAFAIERSRRNVGAK